LVFFTCGPRAACWYASSGSFLSSMSDHNVDKNEEILLKVKKSWCILTVNGFCR
jgi:hypothetical protein